MYSTCLYNLKAFAQKKNVQQPLKKNFSPMLKPYIILCLQLQYSLGIATDRREGSCTIG